MGKVGKGICLLVALFPQVTGASAMTLGEDLAVIFAHCAGRLSAERDHAWLMGQEDAETIEAQRRGIVSLLEAVTPPGEEVATLGARIEAKMAHASLLTDATFSLDARHRAAAGRLAGQQIRSCQMLLLGG